jgi:carbamoyltransferase
MNVLGISGYFHDAAACLVQDGVVIAAAEEERFTRRKHDPSFPIHASSFCLRSAKLTVDDLDAVVFYESPAVKLDRIWRMAVQSEKASEEFLRHVFPRWSLHTRTDELIRRWLRYDGRITFIEHHLAHAASAFYCSPFRDAAIYTVDGVGEWATSAWGTGRDRKIRLDAEMRFPNSLGLLYSAFTYYLGFEVNDGEYKVMGLAPYGKPTFVDRIHKVATDHGDGSVTLDLRYFDFVNRERMITDRFEELFGGRPRAAESSFTQRDWDIAASIQRYTEEVMLGAARHIHKQTGDRNLCMAGGVALNCVANGRILREGPYKELYIQPASGDAGGAIGAALYHAHAVHDQPRPEGGMRSAYLGPEFSNASIESYLKLLGVPYKHLPDAELLPLVAQHIADGKIIGWFHGRMEFGPRALGGRSILGDARPPEMKDIINAKIKLREGFRPFAPAVLAHRSPEYFHLDAESPYMLLVAQVREDHRHIGAVTHLDGSARVQTVTAESNPRFHQLISAFDKLTGVPVIVNTSFNVRGEPIVCTPDDAYRCFMATGIDFLVLENCILDKREQPSRATTQPRSASIAAMAVSPAVYTLV